MLPTVQAPGASTYQTPNCPTFVLNTYTDRDPMTGQDVEQLIVQASVNTHVGVYEHFNLFDTAAFIQAVDRVTQAYPGVDRNTVELTLADKFSAHRKRWLSAVESKAAQTTLGTASAVPAFLANVISSATLAATNYRHEWHIPGCSQNPGRG